MIDLCVRWDIGPMMIRAGSIRLPFWIAPSIRCDSSELGMGAERGLCQNGNDRDWTRREKDERCCGIGLSFSVRNDLTWG
mmetsp:Transcript_753/g.2203  ORF Transcript_753/g.2203 Transcript_753/m.2203 type:complete len:80 (+) Transcript_753:339-578(+)